MVLMRFYSYSCFRCCRAARLPEVIGLAGTLAHGEWHYLAGAANGLENRSNMGFAASATD